MRRLIILFYHIFLFIFIRRTHFFRRYMYLYIFVTNANAVGIRLQSVTDHKIYSIGSPVKDA